MQNARQIDEYESHSQGETSSDKFKIAFLQLTDEQKYKLIVFARVWIRKFRLTNSEITVDDLLQDAITRTLEGIRTWNYHAVDVVKHLDGVMKSIASHLAEKIQNRSDKETNFVDIYPAEEIGEKSTTQTLYHEVERLHSDDTDVWNYLVLRSQNCTLKEVAEEMGKNSTEIEAIKKRAQRRIAKSLGGENNVY